MRSLQNENLSKNICDENADWRRWMQSEPIWDLAHLGHMELLTPKPEKSLQFFVDVMGMTETARKGDSVYLRGWDDYEHHSLQVHRVENVRNGSHGVSRAQPAGAGAARGCIEGIGIRSRLDGWRSGTWTGVSVPRS